jgi:hypothetical protein
MPVEYGSLPFREQIAFFRGKLNLTSRDWTQLWQEGHDHGFVVAGAHRDALVADFRQAVDRVIGEGATLQQFRKDFDRIVAEHGWSYKGSRGWRSRVIYDTNLRTSYAAGRYAQMQAVKQTRPYWRYRHSKAVREPRPQHLAWDGLILHADDPWWRTHYPPNGWGCQCYVETLSERDLGRMGKSGPDKAPEINWRDVRVGTHGEHPRTVRVPEGIDPGFAYAPGATAWTQPLAETAMREGASYRAGDWERLVTTNWADFGRPARIPLEPAPPLLSVRPKNTQEVRRAIEAEIGGPYQVIDSHGLPVAIDAETLSQHLDPARAEFLPALIDALADPFELWLSLERNASGYYALRSRAIKGYDLGRGRALIIATEQANGFLSAFTFVPTSNLRYAQNQRMGKLWYGR